MCACLLGQPSQSQQYNFQLEISEIQTLQGFSIKGSLSLTGLAVCWWWPRLATNIHENEIPLIRSLGDGVSILRYYALLITLLVSMPILTGQIKQIGKHRHQAGWVHLSYKVTNILWIAVGRRCDHLLTLAHVILIHVRLWCRCCQYWLMKVSRLTCNYAGQEITSKLSRRHSHFTEQNTLISHVWSANYRHTLRSYHLMRSNSRANTITCPSELCEDLKLALHDIFYYKGGVLPRGPQMWVHRSSDTSASEKPHIRFNLTRSCEVGPQSYQSQCSLPGITE